MARERQAPTSIGGGVAIPHAFLQGIEKPLVGAFLLQRAIPYGPAESDRVKTVFFLVGREGNTEHHLPILARIARLCSTPEFLQVLGKAKNGRDIQKTILAWDARIGSVVRSVHGLVVETTRRSLRVVSLSTLKPGRVIRTRLVDATLPRPSFCHVLLTHMIGNRDGAEPVSRARNAVRAGARAIADGCA
jgi:mannitol/fructose-specific phosphotransferase system IIA component